MSEPGDPTPILTGFTPNPPAEDPALSPSLQWPGREASAFELKFLLSAGGTQDVLAWARQHLAPDAHGLPELNHAYRVTSLYLDTPELDVFHRMPSFKRRKYRLRRYGSENVVYLERKTRNGDRVRKRRSAVPAVELNRLLEAPSDTAWPGHWFHWRLHARRLRPTCQVNYERHAFMGVGADGPMRLTIDRHLHCLPCHEFAFDDTARGLNAPVNGTPLPASKTDGIGVPLLTGHTILELKYRTAVPGLFKRLMQEMNLQPAPVSKYRHGIEAWGLHRQEREVG